MHLVLCRKHINQDHDEYILSTGDFDERVFLGVGANHEIGTPLKSQATNEDVDETGR